MKYRYRYRYRYVSRGSKKLSGLNTFFDRAAFLGLDWMKKKKVAKKNDATGRGLKPLVMAVIILIG